MTFNNREIALLIWLLLLGLFASTRVDVRESFGHLARSFFVWKIQAIFWLMVAYILLEIYLLKLMSFWNFSFLKDTAYWGSLSSFSLIMKMNSKEGEGTFFTNAVKENVKISATLQYVVALASFSLIVELILTPILMLLGGMIGFTQTKREYRNVSVLSNVILGGLSMIIITHALATMYSAPGGLLSLENIHLFILIPVLTLFYLPFLYLVGVFFQYEMILLRAKYLLSENPALSSSFKRQLFIKCNINLTKLRSVSNRLVSVIDVKDEESLCQFFSAH